MYTGWRVLGYTEKKWRVLCSGWLISWSLAMWFSASYHLFAKVSSPLFELEVQGNPNATAAINEELKLLLEEGELCQEVDDFLLVGWAVSWINHSGGWVLVGQGERQLCQVLPPNEEWHKDSVQRGCSCCNIVLLSVHSGGISDSPSRPEESGRENNSGEAIQGKVCEWGEWRGIRSNLRHLFEKTMCTLWLFYWWCVFWRFAHNCREHPLHWSNCWKIS